MTVRLAWAGLSALATALYILMIGYFSVRIEAHSLGLVLDWTNEISDVTAPTGPAILSSVMVVVASAGLVAVHLVNLIDRRRVGHSVVTSAVSFLMLSAFVVATWSATDFSEVVGEPADGTMSPVGPLLQEAGLSPALLATAGISAAIVVLGIGQMRKYSSEEEASKPVGATDWESGT